MERPTTAEHAPIALENRPLPSGPTLDIVRRRGRGYGPVTADTTFVPAGNRAARRRGARRLSGRVTTTSRLRLAALLVAPAGSLLAASPSFASPGHGSGGSSSSTTLSVDDSTSSSTSADDTTSSSEVDEPSSTTTEASTTSSSLSTSGPTSGTTTTSSAPTTTEPATTTTAGTRPPSTVTTVRTGTSSTTSTTVVEDSTSTSTTVPAATQPLPVGTPELPPETATDADPVAVAASQALELHTARTAASKDLSDIADRHAFADVRVAELETRVSGLTGLAFDYAQQGQPTAEIEAARAAAQADLAIARTEQALLSLQEAATRTIVDDLTARHDDARRALSVLVTTRAGGDAARLDGVWSTTSDARLDVVYAALAQVGDPYVWATNGPDTFDCSGLTEFAWKAAGVNLEHYTVTQRQTTLDVAEGNLRPGDLVFNLNGPNGGHVMLFLGIGHVVVHAPAPGQLVSVSEWRTTTGFGSPVADDELASVELPSDDTPVATRPQP